MRLNVSAGFSKLASQWRHDGQRQLASGSVTSSTSAIQDLRNPDYLQYTTVLVGYFKALK
jgi:hypothetical protein